MASPAGSSPAAAITPDFRRQLIRNCALLFGGGLAVTACILYLNLAGTTVSSYGQGFQLLASLRRELLTIALAIYAGVFLLTLAGIAILSVLYSHRIVGPLYRLSVVARNLANGDLRHRAVLRHKDVVTPLADALNLFASEHGRRVQALQEAADGLAELAADTTAPIPPARASAIRKRIDDMRAQLNDVRVQ